MKLEIHNIKKDNINYFSLNKVFNKYYIIVDKYFYLMYHNGYTELIKTDELLIFSR